MAGLLMVAQACLAAEMLLQLLVVSQAQQQQQEAGGLWLWPQWVSAVGGAGCSWA